MTRVSQVIRRLLGEKSVRQLAQECELSPGTIHAVLDGRRLSPENLRLLVQKISPILSEQRALVLAHLEDELESTGLSPDYFTLEAHDGKRTGASGLSAKNDIDLAIIGRAMEVDEDVRKLVEHLAHVLMRASAEQVDSESIQESDTLVDHLVAAAEKRHVAKAQSAS